MVKGIGEKFSQGVLWFYLLRIGSRVISSLRLIVLARFLSPADFGLMGVVFLVLSLLEMLATTGFDQALIQKKEDVGEYFDTVWFITIARGLVLGIFLFLLAPIAGDFFQEPSSVPLLKVMALSPILIGFKNPGLIELNRELNFRKLVLFDFSRSIVVALVAVISAFLIRDVRALVISTLVDSFILSLSSYFIHPYRPGMDIQLSKAKELWRFGKWIFGSKIAHYLFNDGDDWVVGRLLGAQALGYYQTAYKFGCTPMTEVTSVFSKVAFPTFSTLQSDKHKSRATYLRILQIIMFASTPLTLGLFFIARDGVSVLLGNKWLPIVASLQVLVFWGWVRSFRATTGPILLASGRPDAGAKFTLVKVIFLAILVFPFSNKWGYVGTSWAVLIAALMEMPIIIYSLNRIVGFSYSGVVNHLLRPLIPGIPMGLLLYGGQILLSDFNSILRLIILIILGASIYISITYIFDKRYQWGLVNDVTQALGYNIEPILNRFKRIT